MKEDLLYQIALTQISQVGPVHARLLIDAFSSIKEIFNAPLKNLEKIEGIGSVRAGNIRRYKDFNRCEKEVEFIAKHGIQPLFITDKDYPSRLFHCTDAPILVYYRGKSLPQNKILSVVGTRNPSAYGKAQCENIIKQLPEDVLIVSGLATGIDTAAHLYALESEKTTLGVMAHGHDRIYPFENKKLSHRMLEQGGLLTEFISETQPDRENFPMRNRIVAGIADAVLVIETGEKGGSMITTELANGYNREVFALPGRTTDLKSAGCNRLIKSNKAQLVCNAADILRAMNWTEKKLPKKPIQKELLFSLTPEEENIRKILLNGEKHIEVIRVEGLTAGKIAALLLTLELKGLVESAPGKKYRWSAG